MYFGKERVTKYMVFFLFKTGSIKYMYYSYNNILFLFRITVSPNGTLSITFLDMTDSGVYMCFARNEAGETKKATWIKVNSMFVKKSQHLKKIIYVWNQQNVCPQLIH